MAERRRGRWHCRTPGRSTYGEAGRRPYEYSLTEAGKARPGRGTYREMLTELQAKRAHALMRKGMSERRAIAAVTKGWERPVMEGES